jgi:ankyrin repeat-rich membrane spanning protein
MANLDGYSPLMIAMYQKHCEIGLALLESGASIEGRSGEGCTLMCIATYRRCLQAIPMLISRGADINQHGRYGATPVIKYAVI